MKYLLFHGSVVFLAGLLSGLFYWSAITRDKKDEIHSWRVAHSFLVVDGIFMLVVGLATPHLILSGQALWILVWSIILAGYGFVYAFIIGALKGIRGLTPRPYGLNTGLFAGHIIGASGSLVGLAILIYGFLKAM